MNIMEFLIGLILGFLIGVSCLMFLYNSLCKQVEVLLNHIGGSEYV